jgi:hypothetical protein
MMQHARSGWPVASALLVNIFLSRFASEMVITRTTEGGPVFKCFRKILIGLGTTFRKNTAGGGVGFVIFVGTDSRWLHIFR